MSQKCRIEKNKKRNNINPRYVLTSRRTDGGKNGYVWLLKIDRQAEKTTLTRTRQG